MKKFIDKLLTMIRKNKKNPLQPDVEVNLGPAVKQLLKKKITIKQRAKF